MRTLKNDEDGVSENTSQGNKMGGVFPLTLSLFPLLHSTCVTGGYALAQTAADAGRTRSVSPPPDGCLAAVPLTVAGRTSARGALSLPWYRTEPCLGTLVAARSRVTVASSRLRIPVIGSIARGDQLLNCSVRDSMTRAMEPK